MASVYDPVCPEVERERRRCASLVRLKVPPRPHGYPMLDEDEYLARVLEDLAREIERG